MDKEKPLREVKESLREAVGLILEDRLDDIKKGLR
jgi:hypothetical protein